MTNEELEKEIQEVLESINKLAKPDEPLTKEEIRDRETLTTRKMVLERIKEAKANQHNNDEIYHNLVYSFLKSDWGQKHPFLISIMLRRFKWGMYTGL